MKLPKVEQYPKFLEVRDEKYSIRIVDRIPGQDKHTFGLCDDDDKIIWLRKKQSRRGLFRTLLHELLHAIECEYNIKLKHKRINVLELALEALITDNF